MSAGSWELGGMLRKWTITPQRASRIQSVLARFQGVSFVGSVVMIYDCNSSINSCRKKISKYIPLKTSRFGHWRKFHQPLSGHGTPDH
jgi:hypothetical protein